MKSNLLARIVATNVEIHCIKTVIYHLKLHILSYLFYINTSCVCFYQRTTHSNSDLSSWNCFHCKSGCEKRPFIHRMGCVYASCLFWNKWKKKSVVGGHHEIIVTNVKQAKDCTATYISWKYILRKSPKKDADHIVPLRWSLGSVL